MNIKRKSKRISKVFRKVYFNFYVFFQYIKHILWQLVNGKKEHHLIVCGFSRSGTTMIYNMLRSVSKCDDIMVYEKEISAIKTLGDFKRYIVTKRPLDILDFHKIEKKLSKIRKTKYLFIVRDPRDCISSLHLSSYNQYFQNFDYQFFVDKNKRIASLSYPGIGIISNEIIRLSNLYPDKIKVLRYEDFLNNLEQQESAIKSFSGFPFSGSMRQFYNDLIPEDLKVQLNGVRPIEARNKPAWLEGERFERVMKSYNVFPEIDDICLSLGYPSLADMLVKYSISDVIKPNVKIGTIVAFHTKDERYTQEALRFKSRIDSLELPLFIKSVDNGKDWVENCSKKSSFLLQSRRLIRGPLLYADVDSYLHKDPWSYLSFYSCDIAAYIKKDGELLSGTIFINDTSGALVCLEKWAAEQQEKSNTWDQKILQNIIEAEEAKPVSERLFSFNRLPVSMCKIFDKENDLHVEPYFEHLQVSREEKWGESSKSVIARNKRIQQLFRK